MISNVVVHIGNYKTGTSSIQRFLREHEHSLLRPAGFRYPRGWLRRDKVVELQLALMRLDRLSIARARKDEWRNPAFRAELVRQVKRDLLAHPEETTVLSGEATALLRYDDEIDGLRGVVGDARIIVYWRDPEEWLAAMRDQLTKHGYPPTFDGDPNAFTYAAADSWQVDYDKRTAAWRRHFTDVVTVDYDAAVATDGSVLPSFLRALALPVPDDALSSRYWVNRRHEDDRALLVDGNRWSHGLPFGAEPEAASL